MTKPISVIIVGSGNRANIYASLAIHDPTAMKVVGVVDPDPVRIEAAKKRFGISDKNCFNSVDDLIKREKFADAVINGTMDKIHVETSIPILKAGYDLLLEKPFAVNEEELRELVDVANSLNRKVLICHVLRYAPFYSAIKRHVINGDIGKIISIQLCEHVSYHHMAVSYVRGKWRSPKLCFTPMLLAKSCHDVDLMVWMMSDTKPIAVASFGSDIQFTPENKPEGAGHRCMSDCPYVEDCRFSAKTNYIDKPLRWKQYTWACLEAEGETTIERKIESMKTDNPYGVCVWDCVRDGNVDHQALIVNFANGATGTLNMIGGSAVPERSIHIIGTHGEINGLFDSSKYTLKLIDPKSESSAVITEYDLKVSGDMTGAYGGHGGGDIRLAQDFVDYISGAEPSISCTDINDSTVSHLVVFAAERSRKNGTIELIKL